MSARRPLRSAVALVAALAVGAFFSAGAQAAPGDLDLTFSGDGKQTTDFPFGQRRDGHRAPAGRQDRRGRGPPRSATRPLRLRARPLQPERLARPELLRRRQAEHRFRERGDQRAGVALQDDGKIVAVGAGRRARARRTTRTARSTRASPATVKQRIGNFSTGQRGWRSRATARSSRSAPLAAAILTPSATSRSPVTTPTGRSTRASPATASRRPTSARSARTSGVAIQADGKIVAVGLGGLPAPPSTRSPAITPTARSTRAFPATASRRPISATASRWGGTPGRRQDRGWWRRRPRSALARYNPERVARHELLRRRQADDRLRERLPRSARVAIQGDGKIVAVGGNGGDSDFALARYNPNGTLDTSFSGDGRQITDFGGRLRRGRAGWRSKATGRSSQWAGRQLPLRLVRARPLQPEWLARHELLRRWQADDRLRRLSRRSGRGGAPGRRQDRRGRTAGGISADFALARYNPNGSLDTSFSGDGKQTTEFGGETRRLRWRSRQTARSSWSASPVGIGFPNAFAVARYNPNGTLDTSFSGDGKQTTDFGGSWQTGHRGGDPGERQDRRGGERGPGPRLRTCPLQPQWLARYELLRRWQAATAFADSDGATGVAIQGDGKIVAVGDGGTSGRFRARPLQPQRVARHELFG